MTHSTKEVVHYSIHGIEVLQPGLEPVYPQYANYGLRTQFGEKRDSNTPPERRLCGVRKVTFWLIFTVAALALIAVGVPVGLEVGRSRSQPPADNIASEPSDTARITITVPPPSATASPTSTSSTSTSKTSQLSAFPSTTLSVSSPCPSDNDTIVTPDLGLMRYRLLCDRDFGGIKLDLAAWVLPTFADCMNLCNTLNYFQQRKDVGCTYNEAGTGTQTPGTCWCLGGGSKTIVSNVGNAIAVPVAG